MIKTVDGYSYDTKKSHDSTNCSWYEAKKDGEKYFLKKFKFPRYPYIESTDPDGSKKAECEKWYSMRTDVLKALRKLGDGRGNCRFPEKYFREEAVYHQVTHWVDIEKTSVEDISRLTDKEKLFILKTYSASLSRVHGVGVVHGDIKPDNVIVDKSDNGKYVAKIIDFDDSFFSKKPSIPSLTKSTEEYKSPELAAYVVTDPKKNHKNYIELKNRLTCAVDVFASGIIFHEFWTGSMPKCSDMGAGESFYKAVICRKKFEYDNRIPDWLKALIDDMVQREPEDRPTMKEVFDAIVNESYTKKNAWQCNGAGTLKRKDSKDLSVLKKMVSSIPKDLDSFKPETAVKNINKICDYIKQDLSEMNQNQIDVLTTRLASEIKSLKKKTSGSTSTSEPQCSDAASTETVSGGLDKITTSDEGKSLKKKTSGSMSVSAPLPNGVSNVEIISDNLVKVTMSNGSKTFKTKDQACRMGIVKIN